MKNNKVQGLTLISPKDSISIRNQREAFNGLNSSRSKSQKSISQKSIKKSKQKSESDQLDENILIKACCPNCRYIFKIVNQNKLNAVKSKLKRLQTIHEQQRQHMVQKISNISIIDHGQKRGTPKFQKQAKIFFPNSSINSKSPQNKKTPRSINSNNAAYYQNSRYGNLIKSHVRLEMDNQTQKIKQQIKLVKNYLGKYENKKPVTKSYNVSLDENQQQNPMLQKSFNKQFLKPLGDAQKFSSIPIKKKVSISRKCDKCSSTQIEIEVALAAANSKLIESQLQMVANHVQRQASTPSYIKCLQMIRQNQ